MKNLSERSFFCLLVMLLASCKEAYEPQVLKIKNHCLVAEGMLNNGGLTTIRLSRTRPLNDALETPELKAVASIESESSQSFCFE